MPKETAGAPGDLKVGGATLTLAGSFVYSTAHFLFHKPKYSLSIISLALAPAQGFWDGHAGSYYEGYEIGTKSVLAGWK